MHVMIGIGTKNKLNINLNEETTMNDTKDEMITISKKEYEELQERDSWLTALEHAGVDGNGCLMEEAQRIFEEWDNE